MNILLFVLYLIGLPFVVYFTARVLGWWDVKDGVNYYAERLLFVLTWPIAFPIWLFALCFVKFFKMKIPYRTVCLIWSFICFLWNCTFGLALKKGRKYHD